MSNYDPYGQQDPYGQEPYGSPEPNQNLPYGPSPYGQTYPVYGPRHSTHNYQYEAPRPKRKGTAAAVIVASIVSAVVASVVTVASIGVSGEPAPVVVPQISSSGVVDLDSPALASALRSVFTVAVSDNVVRGSGSGVAISETHIATNAHVVNLGGDATALAEVEVQDAAGNEYAATVVGIDPVADVAVLEVKGAKLIPLAWGDSTDLSVGEGVIAVGAPLGLSNTVTSGIVSALNRPVKLANEAALDPQGPDASTYVNAIQTDTAINSGNSGGALINADGELVGINVAISTSAESKGNIGIGYAIPSTYVKRVTAELVENGEASHGLLGVSVGTVNSKGGNFENGARVQSIESGGAADDSDLRKGDVIVGWDSYPVSSSGALIGFTKSSAPGSTVSLTVRRANREIAVEIKLGSDQA